MVGDLSMGTPQKNMPWAVKVIQREREREKRGERKRGRNMSC